MSVEVNLVGQVAHTSKYAQQIRQLLLETSHEFVPPLNARDSTTSKSFTPIEVHDDSGFDEFVNQTLEEHCLIASADDRFVGFMSFLPKHSEPLISTWSPCTYVVTIAVDVAFRKHGVGRALYDAMFDLPGELSSKYVATRTWVGNDGHIGLLRKLQFNEVHRIENDRGDNIHTVYFARQLSEQSNSY